MNRGHFQPADSRGRRTASSHVERVSSPSQQRRFTLIELLVVVSIISVLAAMLLPALGRARDSAKRLTCMNQVRQITVATLTYADESDDYLPGRNPTRQSIWRHDGDMVGAIVLWENGYIGADHRLMLCPNRATSRVADDRYFANKLWETGYSSYSFTGGSARFKDNATNTPYVYYVQVSRHEPTQALFADLVVNPEPAPSFPWLAQSGHFRGDTWTPQGGNVSYPDGHVAWLEWSTTNWTKPIVDDARVPIGSSAIGWYTTYNGSHSSNKYYLGGNTMGTATRGTYFAE